jgi:hypothetical protein
MPVRIQQSVHGYGWAISALTRDAGIDGAIVVPAALVESVLAEAERLTATEVSIRAELDAGATLAQVLAKYGHV